MQEGSLSAGLHVALGKFELVRPLARGAMGEVWIARHRSLGRDFAIKFLRREALDGDPDAEDERTAMARFRFEAQVAASLSRKTRHIVPVIDHGEELGYAYLVMELVEGDSLSSIMHAPSAQRRIDLEWVAALVAQVAKGLSVAHAEGVFHRDLKPANIVLARDEDGSTIAKILDFGIAKAARAHRVHGTEDAQHPTHATEVGVVLGTPNYMSPEQARGLASLDHRCDVWALATIAYEALTGELPYDGETTADLLVNICMAPSVPIRRLRPELPALADEVFARAFAHRVDERFPTAASFAEALSALSVEARGGRSVAPVYESSSESPTLETSIVIVERRWRARTAVGVALTAFAALALGGLVVRSRRAEAEPPQSTRTEASPVESSSAPREDESSSARASATSEPAPSVATTPTSRAVPIPKVISRAPPRVHGAPPVAKASAGASSAVAAPSATVTDKPVDQGEIL